MLFDRRANTATPGVASTPGAIPCPTPAPALLLSLALAVSLNSSAAPAPATPAPLVDFNHQIRPLLSDRCFPCHGPDEGTREARLRLDVQEDAYAPRGPNRDRRALVPGDPQRSAAYLRIMTADPLDQMPPPESHLALSDAEKTLIRLWIEQGAEYHPHWSFLPLTEVAVPQTSPGSTTEHPIDVFVRARLEPAGLRPAPEAPRAALIRRLSFDLTGLPPTLEAMEAFERDTAPEAYERLVDRLLAEPAYGERRANEWLDLARYADTFGYQSDVESEVWPWRDWVIRAFNQNLPYDQFIEWQLAGDLLPAPSPDQVLATAFNRLHRQTNEGGSIEEEFRAEYAADRVQTAGTAFLGLTLDCARCHDHKFDPISQRDYFRMFAFFNNIDESGLYSHFTRATPTPTLWLYPEGTETLHRNLQGRIASLESRQADAAATLRHRLSEQPAQPFLPVALPAPVAWFDFEHLHDNRTADRIDPARSAALVDEPEPVDGPSGRALQFNGDNSAVCRGIGNFNRTDAFSFSLWLRPTEDQARAVIFHRSRAWTDSGSRGYELVLESMRPAFALVHFWPGNALQVRARDPLPLGVWSRLTITYDGSSRADGLRVYRNDAPLAVEIVRDQLFKDILHRQEWGDADVGGVELTLAGRFRDSGFKHGQIDEFQVFDLCLTPIEVRTLHGASIDGTSLDEWVAQHLERTDPDYRSLRDELAQLRRAENDLVNDIPEIMVMREMPDRRPTFLLRRGAYDAPGDPVEPGVPAAVLPLDPKLPRNRLGLARWMTGPQHPLTARVAANRVWQSCFGRGLVATPDDFGSQGALPTHPELLDWMALNFINSGWDLKALYQLIVTSATYRQSSHAHPGLLARDPDNLLLARGPKHRLEAEQIRDNALAISGLLSHQLGGPSVRPYQPAGLWEESGTGKIYVQDHGDKLYRRSLYTFWRRTAPPPSLLTFDATPREVCAARRDATSTPLQALVLLNDPQYLEAARVLAQRLLRESPANPNLRIERLFRLATGRLPEPREQEILQHLYLEQLALFQEQPDRTGAYLSTGEFALDPTLPPDQVAATTVLASTLMNLHEFVMKR